MTTASRPIVMLAALALIAAACATHSEHTMTDSDLPVACTLTPEQMDSAREGLLPGLLARADRVTELENGLRASFATRPGLLAELAQMMEGERGCCRFLRFNLTAEPAAGAITLDVTGPPGTRELLRSL
jgi:hypothetical protein